MTSKHLGDYLILKLTDLSYNFSLLFFPESLVYTKPIYPDTFIFYYTSQTTFIIQ